MTKLFSNSIVYGYHDQNIANLFPHVQHLRNLPIRALEIGCYEGMWSCWVMDNVILHPESSLVCVDPWDGQDKTLNQGTLNAEAKFDNNIAEYGNRVKKIKLMSQYALPYGLVQKEQFQLIYVDGEHEALNALTDLVLSWQLLTVGGILAFDDYGWHKEHQPTRVKVDPRVAWDAFASTQPEMEILHVGWQVIVKKLG